MFSGYIINKTLQKNEIAVRNVEISVKFIEIATDILSAKPTEDNIELRNWAIQILKKYSPIEITPEIEKQLKETSITKHFLTDRDGNFIVDREGNRLGGR
jgi:hypothetical protein